MPFVGSPKRSNSLKTETGLVLYFDGKDQWDIDYPDDNRTGPNKRYGRASTIQVMNIIYYLGEGYTIDEAHKKVFG